MSAKSKSRAANVRAGKGKCRLCQQEFGHNKIEEHLNKCLESKFPPPADDNKSKYFLVKASAQVYWLYLKAPATATLEDLDGVLRSIWLDCCGHLSTFNRAKLKGKKESLEDFMAPKSIRAEMDDNGLGIRKSLTLDKVLKVGDRFDYEYDMGTPTKLAVEVLAEKFAPLSDDNTVTILARNNHPMRACNKCDEIARKICSECFEVFCNKHKKHGCGSEMLPVANSPRSGCCGYTGNTEDEGDRLPNDEADDDDDEEDEEEFDDDEFSDD